MYVCKFQCFHMVLKLDITVIVFVYWALAFVIGSAVPQVQTILGLVAAICILQFTYTFPPLLIAGYHLQLDAAQNDIGDSWLSYSRWKRAFFGGRLAPLPRTRPFSV